VAVPLVQGENIDLAVENVRNAHLQPKPIARPSLTTRARVVFKQEPDAGTRVDRDSLVKLYYSSGKPTTTVPDVRGKGADEATSILTAAHLQPKIFTLNSSAPENTVTGQDPKPGETVVWGTNVRINVSKGPEPVTVPSVVNLPYDEAAAQLQHAGFAVARQDVENNQPKDTVVSQNPAGDTTAPPHSTVTLYVSKGPRTAVVPDVTGLLRGPAAHQLFDAGFRIAVTIQDVTDTTDNGRVLTQDPVGGSEEPIHSVVTITVGRYTPPTTTAPTTTAETTTQETTTQETTTTAPPP
jgi:serine/threonine-protein kinase